MMMLNTGDADMVMAKMMPLNFETIVDLKPYDFFFSRVHATPFDTTPSACRLKGFFKSDWNETWCGVRT